MARVATARLKVNPPRGSKPILQWLPLDERRFNMLSALNSGFIVLPSLTLVCPVEVIHQNFGLPPALHSQ